LLGGIAEDRLGGTVPVQDLAFWRDGDDRVRHLVPIRTTLHFSRHCGIIHTFSRRHPHSRKQCRRTSHPLPNRLGFLLRCGSWSSRTTSSTSASWRLCSRTRGTRRSSPTAAAMRWPCSSGRPSISS